MLDLLRWLVGGTLFVLAVLFAIGMCVGRSQARDRDAPPAAPPATAPAQDPGDLHGLARMTLPRGWLARGLEGAERSLPPADQLERHDERQPLVFRLVRDPHNDWGGHARDPELLNVVLLPPAARTDAGAALRRFSIDRYYAPTGDTIPLASPRWQEGGDERYRWRVLAMDDHFGTDHAPRWAVAMLDAQRGVRLDYYVWQRRRTQAEALALLRGLLDGLQVTPALEALFSRGGTPEQRQQRLRDARIAEVFAALQPLGLAAPAAGGTAFGRGVAAWLDGDRRALRVIRVVASVPLPGGAAAADRDGQGRPRLPLVVKAGQYPGSTIGGVPEVPLRMLYWNPVAGAWQTSELQRPTMNEAWRLQPVEQAVADRLDRQPGGRDAVHLLMQHHYFHPPVLDDARDLAELLGQSARWQAEVLGGRVIGGNVLPSMLN